MLIWLIYQQSHFCEYFHVLDPNTRLLYNLDALLKLTTKRILKQADELY